MEMRTKKQILKDSYGNDKLGEDASLLLEVLIDIRDVLMKLFLEDSIKLDGKRPNLTATKKH